MKPEGGKASPFAAATRDDGLRFSYAGSMSVTERDLRRQGPGRLLAVCWRQWRTERALAKRGVRFRTANPEVVAAAYAAMSDREFDAINGRQDWANWRTIPRSLRGQLPDRALRVLDLGCGTGSSTQVLAFYCPAGSHLTGFEMAPALVNVALRRRYLQRGGQPARVDFSCQGITEPLHAADGSPVPTGSVDLVNASGVVGHHLTPQTATPLLEELARVLCPGGVATLDVGPTLSATELTQALTQRGFSRLGRRRSWLLDPTGQVTFRKPI
jgi:SAM-dependent methyltransferase